MRFLLLSLLVGYYSLAVGCLLYAVEREPNIAAFPLPPSSYSDTGLPVGKKLWKRLQDEPLNGTLTLTFFLAVLHTFAAPRFIAISHRCRKKVRLLEARGSGAKRDFLRFCDLVFHSLGEVEMIFGIWLLPLAISIIMTKGYHVLFDYLGKVRFSEPIFVVAIMIVAASRPIIEFMQACLSAIASLCGGSVAAWWFSILTFGPLLGSFVTEP